jgi:hypothetical protein
MVGWIALFVDGSTEEADDEPLLHVPIGLRN